MERKLILESCLKCGSWGLLEMYTLLTEDILEFEMISDDWNLDSLREQLSPVIDILFNYKIIEIQHLLLSLLLARCQVSSNISREFPLNKNMSSLRIESWKMIILLQIINIV